MSSWNDRVLLRSQDLMMRTEIPAGSGGMVVNHLQAGILTWEEAEKEMREIAVSGPKIKANAPFRE